MSEQNERESVENGTPDNLVKELDAALESPFGANRANIDSMDSPDYTTHMDNSPEPNTVNMDTVVSPVVTTHEDESPSPSRLQLEA